MNDLKKKQAPSLSEADFEAIESAILKSCGDIAEVIGRSFERLEERIDGAESRLNCRLADIEDRVRQQIGEVWHD
jgi:hypothetical protein